MTQTRHLRTGSVSQLICDRFANCPGFNEEHTAASVNEVYHVLVQILADSAPGTFRAKLLRTLPVYEVRRGQRHRHWWEKQMKQWDKTLTKKEERAWRYGTLIMWRSVSKSAKDDMLKARAKLIARQKVR